MRAGSRAQLKHSRKQSRFVRRNHAQRMWGVTMSLLHEAIVAEKYGLRLTVDQIAKALVLAPQTVYNKIAKGELSLRTYVDGGKRYADYRDVAAYLDSLRATTQV